MKVNGAEKDMNCLKPGPPKDPNTFWEPCAKKATPSASRNGSGAHEAVVEASLRNMAAVLRSKSGWNSPTINLFAAKG
jgi:hypothetical protein